MDEERPNSPSTICSDVFYDINDGAQGLQETYQATNDEYSLPADEVELERLNVQHNAFKIMQGDKNYLAPMAQALNQEEGAERRLLDVGTASKSADGLGTGIWAVEMAEDFPHVQITGIDLSPVQYQHDIPDKCHFATEDAAKGLPYNDGYFDVVHLRALVAGIRDWEGLIGEAVRVTKPAGLVVSVDSAGVFQLETQPRLNQDALAPGFMKFSHYFDEGLKIRGMNTHVGTTVVPRALEKDNRVGPVSTVPVSLPMTPWSDDPMWRRAGEIMVADTKEIPDTVRLLITDACGLSTDEYEQLTKDFLRDLFEAKVHAVIKAVHVWAHKL